MNDCCRGQLLKMSDTWSDIQALKNKQTSLREKLARRKKERQEAVDEIIGTPSAVKAEPGSDVAQNSAVTPVSSSSALTSTPHQLKFEEAKPLDTVKLPVEFIAEVEKMLLRQLTDISLNLPLELSSLYQATVKSVEKDIPFYIIDNLVQKYAAQTLLTLNITQSSSGGGVIIDTIDHGKLTALCELEGIKEVDRTLKRKRDKDGLTDDAAVKSPGKTKKVDAKGDHTIESLLGMQSAKERENKKLSEEILQLLGTPTAKEQLLAEKFRSQGGAQVQEFCSYGTKDECFRSNTLYQTCDKLHFKKIIHKHTDESLGDCSFLNTCFHMDTCKYVHYQIDYPQNHPKVRLDTAVSVKKNLTEGQTTLFPSQWVQCDLRGFNMSVLGKFAVVMADPPWDIHMELPYGTMSDDEMRKLSIPVLQDDGYIFLWVTGRAMELGRECLGLWGYQRVDELIWVKTNQLQRIIRTGRTGHWLNHGKEHCLVGVKGNLKNINRGLDCDVIVAEVRATSHKPDEIYGIIERLSPGTRKIELFGRPHNIQPNWVTLGNQVDGVKLIDPDVVRAFKKVYPDGNCMKPSNAP